MAIFTTLMTELEDVTREVFETMVCGGSGTCVVPAPGIEPIGPVHVVATVAFTGPRVGVVSFRSGTETATWIAGALLGIPAAEVNGEMPDAVGEIANMLAGTLRTRMAVHEPAWAISIPTVTVGSALSTQYSPAVQRASIPVSVAGHAAYVDLALHE
jgi:chemotaxis protein CheX